MVYRPQYHGYENADKKYLNNGELPTKYIKPHVNPSINAFVAEKFAGFSETVKIIILRVKLYAIFSDFADTVNLIGF